MKNQAYHTAEERIEAARRSKATELDLSANWNAEDDSKLTELPKSLSQLTHLQWLNLSEQKLETLPEWIGQLTELKTLYVTENRLRYLPESLGELTKLQHLNLSFNRLGSGLIKEIQ
uniref:Leucine rich repeat-containing protein n=1 Tax=Candidatus Kentrum sp. FW TaxID=2126338 RepID=A0A450U3N8_9GAMM|nr:MAG: Leucine rich repeat-containing protein [Candidatus Kentron sp. FW]